MSLDTIIKQLPQLSVEELDLLASRIKALRSLGGNQAQASTCDETEDLDMVIRCAADVAHSLGADLSSFFQLRTAARQSPAFRRKIPYLLQWLHEAVPTRAQQQALLHLAFRLLYHDMTEMGLVVTARTFLAHTHRLPAVIDRNFPGYFNAGSLSWVVGAKNGDAHLPGACARPLRDRLLP